MRLSYPLVAMLLIQFISGAYALTDLDVAFAADIIKGASIPGIGE